MIENCENIFFLNFQYRNHWSFKKTLLGVVNKLVQFSWPKTKVSSLSELAQKFKFLQNSCIWKWFHETELQSPLPLLPSDPKPEKKSHVQCHKNSSPRDYNTITLEREHLLALIYHSCFPDVRVIRFPCVSHALAHNLPNNSTMHTRLY